MKIITEYGQFLNENIEAPKEILNILDFLKNTPTEDILNFRDSLKQIASSSESLNENFISEYIDKIKLKFRNMIDDRIWKYLIFLGFVDYEENLIKNSFSNVMFKNQMTFDFLNKIKPLLIYTIESNLVARNWFNYTVNKYYNKHIN